MSHTLDDATCTQIMQTITPNASEEDKKKEICFDIMTQCEFDDECVAQSCGQQCYSIKEGYAKMQTYTTERDAEIDKMRKALRA